MKLEFLDTPINTNLSECSPDLQFSPTYELQGRKYKLQGMTITTCKPLERLLLGIRAIVQYIFPSLFKADSFHRQDDWRSFIHGKTYTAIYYLKEHLDEEEKKQINSIRSIIFDNEKLTTLFSILKGNSPLTLKEYFNQIGKENVLEILTLLTENYDLFLKWIKEIGHLEYKEPNTSLKKEIRIQKGIIVNEIYEQYAIFLQQITKGYLDILVDIVRSIPNSKEPYPTTIILSRGIEILFELYQKKKSIGSNSFTICKHYQDYQEKLRSISVEQEGRWYFGVRCKEDGLDHGIHHSSVYIEKQNGVTKTFILDSMGYLKRKHYIARLTNLTHEIFPSSEIYTSALVRQYDGFNCGYFVFKDLKNLHKIEPADYRQLFDQAKSLDNYFPPNSPLNTLFKANPSLPITFIKLIQSLKNFNEILAKANSNAPNYDKLKKVNHNFIITDTRANKDFGVYTKTKGVAARLKILLHVFQNVSSL